MSAEIPAPTEEWQLKAECRGRDPELWYAKDQDTQDYVKTICLLDCPVYRDCGLTALRADQRWGIWAGHNMADAGEMEQLAEDLGVPAPFRPVRQTRLRSYLCTECGTKFTAPTRRDKCENCVAERMPTVFVREFIVGLMAQEGMTYQRIADLAGPPVTRSWVAHIASGRKQSTSAELARRLFSIASVGVSA